MFPMEQLHCGFWFVSNETASV